ncbi:MAG: selenide, water dikinase SelD [Bacteroidales bacterium]|nr:selenide, water dikinase SelD [Bacteroidales bacterium]
MEVDLLKFTDSGGCSAKISPAQLQEVLKVLPLQINPDILVDIDTHDDAGVYRVNDELALVLTTDFFPPVCSDPYEFGQIAAANSLSDVYAMGAKPVVALNIMMFPASKLPMEAYAEILRGGYDKAAEAGVSIIGGHTIDDAVPKYGMAVTGFVHPQSIITNAALREGDVLILTKPVGTGTILAASRLGLADNADLRLALDQMKVLNNKASAIMCDAGVRSATDITGFGLGGHALKMAKASGVTIRLSMESVPLIGKVLSYTDSGCIPGASFRNLAYAEPDAIFDESLDYNYRMLAFDAQTSGGLLMGVRREKVPEVLAKLKSSAHHSAAVVGNVTAFDGKYLFLGNR